MDMSAQALRAICVQNKLYRTPHLNDNLYANFKGFRNLCGLEQYVNLKALFLEGNALEDLHDMPLLNDLKCLCVKRFPRFAIHLHA
jgi:dynein assembly factor 1, axonemal